MVVSGEYITHLTRTAQREIDNFMDPRLACLTLGDAGMAMILEQAPADGVGFQDIDLYTLGKYHHLCVAKASPQPEGGAIMFTDPVQSAAVTIKEAVKHCLEALDRNRWAPEALKWLIMHQTSAMTLDGATAAINQAKGRQVAHRGNTIYHLAQRGNTATNSHFLAVRENIDSGRIAPGDKVFFAVSGSGQVVGSALYTFDDLPTRLAGASSPARPANAALANPGDGAGLQMFECQRRIGITCVGVLPEDYSGPFESVPMLRGAGEVCLGRHGRDRVEIDLVIHTGTYRTEFLCEPALAAIAAGELHINHEENNPGGRRTFAFDLTSGAAGTLTACFLASQLLGAGKYSRALLLASEVENNAQCRPDHLLGLKETASALILEEGKAGFLAFGFRSFSEYVASFETGTTMHNQQAAVACRKDAKFEKALLECLRTTIAEFLTRTNKSIPEIRWFLFPQRSAAFLVGLAQSLAIPEEKLLRTPEGDHDYFTSALAHGFDQPPGRIAPGDTILIAEASAGIQVVCGLYQA
jgi:3-oxoacyl-[acyl-carrier-protein] synthase III